MATKRAKFEPKPGAFYYFSGDVWEADNRGRLHRRRDCGPNGRGKFRHKYYTGKKP